jgi:hypothetical protein
MTAEPAFRRRPTFIRVTVELPADLIKEAELAVEGGGGRPTASAAGSRSL